MPFTVEELDEMQKEAEAILAEDTDSSEVSGEKKEDEVKKEEEKPEDGGKGQDSKTEENKETENKEAPVKDEDLTADDIRDLRKQLRDAADAYAALQAKTERIEKILKEQGVIDPEDEKAREEKEAQNKKAYDDKIASLNTMLETMRLIPGYEDVDEVVSQENFDDIVRAYATFYVKENGGNLNEVIRETEREIWARPNPYSFMYPIIKKVHPKYAEKVVEKKVEEKKAVKEEDVAPSLQKLPGGSGNEESAGWTAAKLDDMDEFEIMAFQKSHPDVYDKYMKGTLK